MRRRFSTSSVSIRKTSGRRWQMHKIDELGAKGCIPLDIFRKRSDFTQFNSHKTLWQLIWSFYYVTTNLNETKGTPPADVSILTGKPTQRRIQWHAPADMGLEGAQRGSGSVTGLDLLIDEMTWMKSGQRRPFENSSSQNKFINRPFFKNP